MADAAVGRRRKDVPPAVILGVVSFGVFVAADDLTVVSTMLRPIIGDLGIPLPGGLDQAAWLVNAYLVAYVAVMPIVGRLSDIFGRRKVFVAAMTLFMIGSIWIPLTDSYGPFLFGRILTAIGGGAMVPVGMAVVGDVYRRKRATALGTLAAIDTLGWVWGPIYGAILVRFLSWRWQFWLNVPLAVAGIVVAWWALAGLDRGEGRARLDWVGAITATIAIVALNIALLSSAQIQNVSGLEELTGASSGPPWWLYGITVAAGVVFVVHQRRTADPLIDLELFRGRRLSSAVAVNFLAGAALVIAMVDVPLFVNVLEVDIERSAVQAGWLLTALTAAMAVTSYIGGRLTEEVGYRSVAVAGLVGAAAGYLLMGFGWDVGVGYPAMAIHLALLGLGFGLINAPVTAAVIDAAPAPRRGTAAGLVILFRLFGLSVGLSGLTAYGLWRFNQLRNDLDLPPITDPAYQEALQDAQARLTAGALSETFLAAAVVLLVGIAVATMMARRRIVTVEDATEIEPVVPGEEGEMP